VSLLYLSASTTSHKAFGVYCLECTDGVVF
jgi:hypothetical protein